MSLTNRLFAGFVLCLVLSCAGTQKSQVGPRGALRFNGEPVDALLEVDEIHVGPIGMFKNKGLLLRPGEHRIIVKAPGYFTEYRIVEVKQDKVLLVTVQLRARPD